jgi:hypothetical protein
MANPTVSASLDKTTYAPGERMTLTVSYGDPDTKTVAVTVQVTDAAGNKSGPVTVNAVIDPLTLVVSDSARSWTKVSDTGAVAVFTATA